ncbi:hypothetical protein WMY93_034265 [Mugilogobius chulae]|uniref:Uncharacterized protein n=1 Tax=Mugilogobius chulae TaxID=88201 RepID=A0AAW0MF39_9GOBI
MDTQLFMELEESPDSSPPHESPPPAPPPAPARKAPVQVQTKIQTFPVVTKTQPAVLSATATSAKATPLTQQQQQATPLQQQATPLILSQLPQGTFLVPTTRPQQLFLTTQVLTHRKQVLTIVNSEESPDPPLPHEFSAPSPAPAPARKAPVQVQTKIQTFPVVNKTNNGSSAPGNQRQGHAPHTAAAATPLTQQQATPRQQQATPLILRSCLRARPCPTTRPQQLFSPHRYRLTTNRYRLTTNRYRLNR